MSVLVVWIGGHALLFCLLIGRRVLGNVGGV